MESYLSIDSIATENIAPRATANLLGALDRECRHTIQRGDLDGAAQLVASLEHDIADLKGIHGGRSRGLPVRRAEKGDRHAD